MLQKYKDTFSLYVTASILVGLAFLGISLWGWFTASQRLKNQIDMAAAQRMQTFRQSIQKQAEAYEEILRGGMGLYHAVDGQLNPEIWKNYVTAYSLETRHPGMLGVGWAPIIHPDDVSALEATLHDQGVTDYQVTPAVTGSTVAPVVYIEPSLVSVGFDLYSESVRRSAIENAVATGQAAVSGKITLLRAQDTRLSFAETSGFIMFYPVYKKGMPTATAEERRAAQVGLVYAPFLTRDFLASASESAPSPFIALKVYDTKTANDTSLMFKSPDWDKLNAHRKARHYMSTASVGNHTWSFDYVFLEDIVSARDRVRPIVTLISGLVFTAVLTLFLFQLLTSRERSLRYAQAQQVQEAKDELLSLASHQLRTPATGVKQYIGILLEGYEGELTLQQRKMLEMAYESNERQLQIINQILYVARSDSGRILLNLQPVDLKELLGQVVEEQRGAIEAKKQRLTFIKPRRKITIHADRQYLHMALDNVVNNASKYSHEKARITVKVDILGHTAVVTISDTGIGIDPAGIDTIFDKFTRLQNELSTHVGGSGIGLYLTKQIVTLHKGRIRVTSEVNKGSTFTIYLPLHSAQRKRRRRDERQ